MDQNILINKYKTSFRKELGQNFLVDNYYSDLLVESAKLTKEDIVVEIGTGLGAITFPLSDKVKQVFTFEKDKDTFEDISNELAISSNITAVNLDLLQTKETLSTVIHSNSLNTNRSVTEGDNILSYKVVASLPYNVSKRVINYFLSQENLPTTMTYILQKEVALKYSAVPPKATFLSNLIYLYGTCEYIETVPKEAFYPIPKVDGGIIHIVVNKEGAKTVESKLIKFIKIGFSSPRKTIANVLSAGLHVEKKSIEAELIRLDISPNLRAENLTLDQWKILYKNLNF